MRTIFYLIDLYTSTEIESYEGKDDEPPQKAKDDAEKRSQATGHSHVLARGTLFFQKDK